MNTFICQKDRKRQTQESICRFWARKLAHTGVLKICRQMDKLKRYVTPPTSTF